MASAAAAPWTGGGSVTNFYRNTDAYNRAGAHNGTLDRDNDKIACEKGQEPEPA